MPNRQLALGTISFAVCFAAWGLISAFASTYPLSSSQTALLVAAPVLLGSLARVPMGLLTDRYKGRAVFTALLLFSAIPPLLISAATSYTSLLAGAFLLGLAGSSFAVGVGFVSPWFPKERQGAALGIYGLGNAGQSLVVFLGPVLAAAFGRQNVFRGVAVLLAVWAIVFAFLARNAPDMCYNRTSTGKRPMCATVCPSQALAYLSPEEIKRRREKPVNTVRFGNEVVRTKVYLMTPADREDIAIDITDYMWEAEPA